MSKAKMNRRPSCVVEEERAEAGNVTLLEKRLGVPNLNGLRKMPSTEIRELHWVALEQGIFAVYRNKPDVTAPEVDEEVPNLGTVFSVMKLTRATWLVNMY